MIALPRKWAPGAGDAAFSQCDRYRWWLRRRWEWPRCDEMAFIGLNPSTADKFTDDPTVARCVRRAMRAGKSGMWMLNAFAFRATDPRDMLRQRDPVGQINDRHILDVCKLEQVSEVVLCWGGLGRALERSAKLLKLLEPVQHKLRYLDLTRGGEPRHPLYLRNDLELKRWADRNANSTRSAPGAKRDGSSAISRRRRRSLASD